jgi:precorrin-6A/cobalt-precorrin-6A reductase
VRQPQLPCAIHSGGFGGVQGLIHFIQQQGIDGLLDATHPYAVKISDHAQLAAKYCRINCFHYSRPAWQPQAGDRWIFFKEIKQLTVHLEQFTSRNPHFLFTLGQLSSAFLAKKNPQHHYILRSALTIDTQQTKNITTIKQIGPFSAENERKLFQQYALDALISKNSGGQSVAAKIKIARERQLCVYMLQRPDFKSTHPIFTSLNDILGAVRKFKGTNLPILLAIFFLLESSQALRSLLST